MSTIKKMRVWDPKAYRDGIQVHSDKIFKILKSKKIEISLVDDNNSKLNNLTFYGGGNTIKMSHHSFYRYAGMGMKVISGKNKDELKCVSLPINEYMERIIVPIILKKLKI